MSSHKKSLIITVQYYYEKAEDLPYKYKKWFDKPIEKILKSTVKQIQNWIGLTKTLFKANRTYRTEYNKITNYFITEDNPTTSLDTIPMANNKEINTNDKDLGKHSKSININRNNNKQNEAVPIDIVCSKIGYKALNKYTTTINNNNTYKINLNNIDPEFESRYNSITALESGSEKTKHTSAVNELLSSDSEFSINNIIQHKHNKTNQYNREESIPSESSNLDTDSKYTKPNEQFIQQRRQYNTRSKKWKQKTIVNSTYPEGKQKYRDHNDSTNETDSNNSYDISNYNTESD